MTLENFLGIGFEKKEADSLDIQKLIQASDRCLKDASIKMLSYENRFDIANRAVIQLAHAALQANGFRCLPDKPMNYQLMIQSLPQTIGLDHKMMLELSSLREQANLFDGGEHQVTEQLCSNSTLLANRLYLQVNDWMEKCRPHLIEDE